MVGKTRRMTRGLGEVDLVIPIWGLLWEKTDEVKQLNGSTRKEGRKSPIGLRGNSSIQLGNGI